MRFEQLLRFLVLPAFATGLGVVVGASCSVNYKTFAFRCNPRQADNCPETHYCCSDDPSTADGKLPDFAGKGIPDSSAPLFAGINNAAGVSGMCVNRDELDPAGSLADPEAEGCPIPCNPTWSKSQVDSVCGPTRSCCQTAELEPQDCVQENGVWRAVTGADIGSSSVSPRTGWARGAHATHQDPSGTRCLALAGGDQQSAVFAECIKHLTVADQRGFCMSLQPGTVCPAAAPEYVDACEAQNAQPPATGG